MYAIYGVTFTINKNPSHVSINLPYDWILWVMKYVFSRVYGIPWTISCGKTKEKRFPPWCFWGFEVTRRVIRIVLYSWLLGWWS